MIDIDFNQISPEYYLDKANELSDKFRIEFIFTKEDIERLGSTAKGIKIGDIGTQNPEWPDKPKEAFELFKNYYAQQYLLTEVSLFLKKYYTWNQKAIKDTLNTINQFIEDANKIHSDEVFNNRYHSGDKFFKIIYSRLLNDYYNFKHIESDSIAARSIYGKYFLFKELLLKKLNHTLKSNTETPDGKTKNNYSNIFTDENYSLFNYLDNNYIQDNNSLKAKYSYIYHFLKYENRISGTHKLYKNFILKEKGETLSKILPKQYKYDDGIKPLLTSLLNSYIKSNNKEQN